MPHLFPANPLHKLGSWFFLLHLRWKANLSYSYHGSSSAQMRRSFSTGVANRVPPFCWWDTFLLDLPHLQACRWVWFITSQKYIFFTRALTLSYYTKACHAFNIRNVVCKHVHVMMRRISSSIKTNVILKIIMPDFIGHGCLRTWRRFDQQTCIPGHPQ